MQPKANASSSLPLAPPSHMWHKKNQFHGYIRAQKAKKGGTKYFFSIFSPNNLGYTVTLCYNARAVLIILHQEQFINLIPCLLHFKHQLTHCCFLDGDGFFQTQIYYGRCHNDRTVTVEINIKETFHEAAAAITKS